MPTPAPLGLSLTVRRPLEALLHVSTGLWLRQEPTELKRVVRRTGIGQHSINFVPYRGVRAISPFMRGIEILAETATVRRELQRAHPELRGFVVLPGHTQALHEPDNLVPTWCLTVADYVENGQSEEQAISTFLAELDASLREGRLTQSAHMIVSGLSLPEETDPIRLENGLLMRLITDDEASAYASHDVLSGSPSDPWQQPSAVLIAEAPLPFHFGTDAQEQIARSSFQEDAQRRASEMMIAFHIAKSGRAAIASTSFQVKPRIFPLPLGHTQWPLTSAAFPSMDLNPAELEMALSRLTGVLANTRDEFSIAASRLRDAEHRLSPIDALMDAAIGLEVLLNPNDSSELAFRVALNYALLSSGADQRERYELLRSIQKIRNRVVHGGLNSSSPDAALIHQHAQFARNALRDSLNRFINDRTLTGNRKLNVEFWLDRLLPPAVLRQS